MAFTQAQLEAQIDSASTGRVVTIGEFLSNPSTITDVYAVGVIAPYAGRSRWVQILQTRTAAQAWSDIQTALGN